MRALLEAFAKWNETRRLRARDAHTRLGRLRLTRPLPLRGDAACGTKRSGQTASPRSGSGRVSGGVSHRVLRNQQRADSFRGPRKATPSPVPALNLRGSSCLNAAADVAACSDVRAPAIAALLIEGRSPASMERRKAMRVSFSPPPEMDARRDDNTVAPRGAPFPLILLRGANEPGLARAFEGALVPPGRRLARTGNSAQPRQRASGGLKSSNAFVETFTQRRAAICRAESGSGQTM